MPPDPCFPHPAPQPPQVEHIISFLPVRDVVALGQTCHYFHQVCDAESVWRRICHRLSPRLREQGSGVRPWKRAAILNCTPSPKTSSSLCLCPTLSWGPSCSIKWSDDLSIPSHLPGPLSLQETAVQRAAGLQDDLPPLHELQADCAGWSGDAAGLAAPHR